MTPAASTIGSQFLRSRFERCVRPARRVVTIILAVVTMAAADG